MGQDKVSGEVNVLCWLAAPVVMFYGNLPKFVNKVKIGNKVHSVISSEIAVMSVQLRLSL